MGGTFKCREGHKKTCNARWFLSHPFPSMFSCKFCEAKPGHEPGEVVNAYNLIYKQLDYVLFYPRPGIDNQCVMGRVAQVNKKSLGVVTADGKKWTVKDLKAVRRAEGEPSVEIDVAKRKRTEEDKLR